MHFEQINFNTLLRAVIKTCKKRKTHNYVQNTLEAINVINSLTKSITIKKLWQHHQKCYSYTRSIKYETVMNCILDIAKYAYDNF
jgi:uncharacterized protein with HEPN domain